MNRDQKAAVIDEIAADITASQAISIARSSWRLASTSGPPLRPRAFIAPWDFES